MIVRYLFLLGLMASLTFPLLAQKGGTPGRANYFDYEREEVSYYRDQVAFQLPSPTLPERPRHEQVQPISLRSYFGSRNAYYIDSKPALNQLVSLHQRIGEKTQTMQGYRIMVYSGNSRNTALGIKSQLLAMNIQHRPYLDFDAPNIVVRLGDFMDREDAILFLRTIQSQYPSAFIVPDKINIPKYQAKKDPEQMEEDPFAPIDDQD
jgi:hypothetical protein